MKNKIASQRTLAMTVVVVMLFVVGCTPIPDPSPIARTAIGGTATPTVLPTTTLSPAEIEATSTSQAKTQIALEIKNQQSTRNAISTVSAGGINATLTVQAAQSGAVSTLEFMRPAQTQAAATTTSVLATQSKAQTATAFVPQATQTQAAIDKVNRANTVDNVWEVVKVLGAVAIITSVCLVIIWAGRAFRQRVESDTVTKTRSVVTVDGVAYFLQWNFKEQDWDFSPIIIEQPKQIDRARVEDLKKEEALRELHGQWAESILKAAHAASIVGSWSYEELSTTKHREVVISQDGLKDIKDILLAAGWLKDYRGSRGIDWVEGLGGLVGLREQMERGEFRFTLPCSNDTPPKPKPAPEVDLDNAMQGEQREQGKQRKTRAVLSPKPA